MALCALLLAGCAGPPSPPADGVPAVPARTEMPIEVDAGISPQTSCLPAPAPQFCFVGAGPTVLLATPRNATVRALEVHIGAQTLTVGDVPLTDEVHVELRCRGGRPCARSLAEADVVLPHDIILADLDLPLGARIELRITAQGDGIASSWAQQQRTSRVTGTAAVEWFPAMPPQLVHIPVVLEGHTGPCDFVEANCTHAPGGSNFVFEDLGNVVALDLVMTWAAPTAVDQTLGIDAWTWECDAPCPESVEARGTSPLRLTATDLDYDGLRLGVDAGQVDAVAADMPGARTPVRITGSVTVLEA